MNRANLNSFRTTAGVGQQNFYNQNQRSNNAMPQSPYQNYNQGGMQSGGRPVRQGPGNRYIPPTYNFGQGLYGADYNNMNWNNVQNYDLPQQGNNPYQQQYMNGLRGSTGRFGQGGGRLAEDWEQRPQAGGNRRGPQMPRFRGQGGRNFGPGQYHDIIDNSGGYGGGGLPQGYSYDQPDNGMIYTAVMPRGGGRYAYGPSGDRIEVGGDYGGDAYPNDNFDFGDIFGGGGPQMPNFRNGGYGGPYGGGGYGVGFGGGYGGGRGGGNMQQFMQMMQQYMQGQGGRNGPNAGMPGNGPNAGMPGNGPNAGGPNGGGNDPNTQVKPPWEPGGGGQGNAPPIPGKDGNPLQIGGNNTNAPPIPGKDGTPLQIGGNNTNAPPNGGNGGGSNWWEDPSYGDYFQNWMRMMNGFNGGGGNAPPPPNGGNGGGGGF